MEDQFDVSSPLPLLGNRMSLRTRPGTTGDILSPLPAFSPGKSSSKRPSFNESSGSPSSSGVFFFFSLFPEHSLCLASFVYVRQTRQLERRLHGHVQVLCS